ncbi:MAG TPA: type II secretion system protein [Candidatus Bathyarchaeia archaeon]|nr:type II secretion system protein [Candidatus Bathyarchaeia archaeon]
MKRKINNRGATLVEVLVTAAILAVAVTGILMSYLQCMELTEVAKNMSRAVQAAQTRMEQIRSTPYTTIKATYDNIGFSVSGLNGYGASFVNDTAGDLLEIRVVVCWKQKNGRVYGEDANLNGLLNVGEDENSNGVLDSPVMLVARLYER